MVLNLSGGLFRGSSTSNTISGSLLRGPGRAATIIVAKDGSGDTDDIAEGITLLPSTGGVVFIKEGTYTVNSKITITKANITIQGTGKGSKIVSNVNSNPVFDVDQATGVTFKEIYIDTTNTTNGDCIKFSACFEGAADSCWLDSARYSIDCAASEAIRISNNHLNSKDTCIQNAGRRSSFTNNVLGRVGATANVWGMEITSGGDQNTIAANVFNGVMEGGINVSNVGATDNIIAGNIFFNCVTDITDLGTNTVIQSNNTDDSYTKNVIQKGTAPSYKFEETDSGANIGNTELLASTDKFFLRSLNDDDTEKHRAFDFDTNTGNFVFNELGNDADFRVEGTNYPHALFLEASTGRVMIGGSGTTEAGFAFHVVGDATKGRNMKIEADSSAAWLFEQNDATANEGIAQFVMGSSLFKLRLLNDNLTEKYEVITISSADGSVVFNEDGNDADFRVEGDTEQNLLFCDASTDRIGIGNNSPTTKLAVTGDVSVSYNSSGAWLDATDVTGTGVSNLNYRPTLNGTGNQQAISAVPTFDPQGTNQTVYCLNTNVRVGGAASNTVSNLYSIFTQCQLIEDYNGTITNLYGMRINGLASETSSGSPTVTNQYGIFIADPTIDGSTLTIAYYTNMESGSGKYGFFADGTADNRFDGKVGIGGDPTAQLDVDQSSTTAAIPVLLLDQADISEEFIEFNTTIGTGNSIEAIGAKTLTTTHFIKIKIPGGLTRYIPCGTIA